MKKIQLSLVLARTFIALTFIGGFYGLVNVGPSSTASFLLLGVQGFLFLVFVLLFTKPDIGRLLSGAVFVTIGLLAAAAAAREAFVGAGVALIGFDIGIAIVHLALAWHTLVQVPDREREDQRHLDPRT